MSAVDPVTVQILRNRVSSVMEEMHYHFYRSGYSTIVRESRDFSCVILDADGRLIVPPPMFFHGTVYLHLVRRILEIYGADGLQDGDVLICNHPYEGNLPHVPDMAVIRPVFVQGRLIAFAGSIAHKADVGGTVPGSTYGQATELFQEGMLLPPVKLYRAGAYNTDLERLVAANSRAPELVLGDLGGQVGVAEIGAARVAEMCARFGAEVVLVGIAAAIDGAAARFEKALRDLPPATHHAEGFLDSDGVDRDEPVRIRVAVTVENGRATFDFDGSSPQTRGPVNLRPAMVEAVCCQALLGVLDPDLPYSDAVRALVEICAPHGSVLAAEPPAPVSSYMTTCQKLVDVVLDALGQFRPARAIAHSGGSGGALTIAWKGGGRAHPGNQYEIFGSALGAMNGTDGTSGVTVHLSNLYITPIEMIETEFPCRIARFELVPDSGGAGRHRGGLSFRRRYELLAPATVIYRGDRARVPPKGLAKGRDGVGSRLLAHPGSPDEARLPASCRIDLGTGDSISVEGAGGGGYGEPIERDQAALDRDLLEGYVTEAGLKDYGRVAKT